MVEATACAAARPRPTFPEVRLGLDDLAIEHGYVGRGYALPTPKGSRAIELVRQHAGLELDPTYTAKTFAALNRRCAGLRSQVVLYWHTYDPGRSTLPAHARRICRASCALCGGEALGPGQRRRRVTVIGRTRARAQLTALDPHATLRRVSSLRQAVPIACVLLGASGCGSGRPQAAEPRSRAAAGPSATAPAAPDPEAGRAPTPVHRGPDPRGVQSRARSRVRGGEAGCLAVSAAHGVRPGVARAATIAVELLVRRRAGGRATAQRVDLGRAAAARELPQGVDDHRGGAQRHTRRQLRLQALHRHRAHAGRELRRVLWFAKDLPGPPIEIRVELRGELVSDTTLLRYTPGE